MHRCLAWLLLLSVALGAAPAGVTLKDGTPVLLLTEEKLVSGETPEGSVALFRVERNLLGPGGQVLISSGTKAYGKVLKSAGRGFLGGGGELSVSIDSTTATDGTSVPLRAVREASGEGFFLGGDEAEIPKGSLSTAYVNRDTRIGRPAGRLSPAEVKVARSVRVTVPAADGRVKKEDQVVFSCSAYPRDDSAYVRILIDGDLVAGQKGDLSRIVWDTEHNEELLERAERPGSHSLVAELTFSNGWMVKSTPVRFTLED